MSEKELLKALEYEARRERDSILEDARKKAKDILEKAEGKKKKHIATEIERIRLRLKRDTEKILNEGKREGKRLNMELKNKILTSVFDEAWKEIIKIGREKRSDVMVRLFEEVIIRAREEGFKKGLAIYLEPDVLPIVKDKMAEVVEDDVEIKLIPKEGMDGVLLSAECGKIEFLNTLRARFDKARRSLLPEIGNILFENAR